jgi:hypothetical protein
MEVAMKIRNRQQLLIVFAIAAFALLVGNSLIYEPLSRWWSARSQMIADLRKQVKDGKLLIQREPGLRERWSQMSSNTLPDNTSQAEQRVFKALDGWARESGTEISGIMPQWKNDADDYRTLNCRVEASGNLGTLTRFIYNIQKGPMALRINSMELTTRDTVGQQLTLGLQVSGLVLLSNPKQ